MILRKVCLKSIGNCYNVLMSSISWLMLYLCVSLVSLNLAHAQNEKFDIQIFDKTVNADSESKAREIMSSQSSVEAVRAYGKQDLGLKAYVKNKVFIQQNLINLAGKYIRKITIQNLSVENSNSPTLKKYSAKVTVEVSGSEIHALFDGAGLLSASGDALQAMAFISVKDESKNRDYRWWYESPKVENEKGAINLEKIYFMAETKLAKSLEGARIFLLENNRYPSTKRISKLMRKKFLNEKELAILALKNGVDLVVAGNLEISSNSIEIKLRITHIKNSRKLADVIKSVPIDSFLDERQLTNRILDELDLVIYDLSQQLLDVNLKGQIFSKVIELSISPAIKFNQLQIFKTNLLKMFSSIKGVRERRLSQDSTVLELEVQGNKNFLVESMRKKNQTDWRFTVSDDGPDAIKLKMK